MSGITSSGQQNMKAATTPVANSAADKKAGRAYNDSGHMHNFDATAALPALAFVHNGIAITPDGRICTTTGTPALKSTVIGGIAFRADGAMHVTTAAVSSTSVSTKDGRFVSPTGALHIVAN